jgi:membrane fusion protein (multidrug efflux system)
MKRILVIIGVVFTLCYTSCKTEKEKEEKVEFLVTNPLKKDTTIIREYVCQIRAIQHIELRALVGGYLQEIFVDEGKYIDKGQRMFQILPIQYQAELNKAQAEANYAEIEYQNTKSLADSNIVSKNELALAKAKFEKAKAEVAYAQTRMTFTDIKAPFSGLMDRFHVRLGSLLAEGDLLTTLSDNSEMWVYFNVPEAEYLDYKSDGQNGDKPMEVRLKMANHQLFKYPGYVKTIEADFNNETGNIAFRATFPNPDKLLRHGETGNVVVTIPLKDAIIIPQKATYEVLDQKFVFVVDKNNVLKTRRITVGAEMPDLYVISKGLDEHDKILLEGLRLVDENDTISYKYQDPKNVITHLVLHAE